MKPQSYRFHLLVFILFLASIITWDALFREHTILLAESDMPERPAAQLYLPLVGQGAISADHGVTVTPTPTATEVATETPTTTATSTPTETPTTQPPPPAQNGFFALTDWLSYNAATAVDPQGGVHLAFYVSDERHRDEPLGQPAFYAYCPGPVPNCADPSNWGNLVQFDSAVNEVQVVVTTTGQPRLRIQFL
jgi:hypothetical protein